MAITLKQLESTPAAYPDPPDNLSAAAAALDPAVVWQRIEAYTGHRFGSRAVVWIVEGPGEWLPPLQPATIETVEVWSRAGDWEDAELIAAPLGHWLPASGPYRFAGTAGDDNDPPAVVLEAYRRLAEYMAAKPGKPGATAESISAGSITILHRRAANWMAMALQNSGAADLLRPYRNPNGRAA